MATGVYRAGILGEEEVPQKDIDFWCGLCQFPIASDGKCQAKAQIQQCWNEIGAVASVWHRLHECPFTHVVQKCRCNDFKTLQEAFASVGLVYQVPK